ncbi:MAG: DUF4349 domain-containing protein [Treponema sp.]|nr:DUF4349 domain-containing protein [Treponema sp.]
MLFQKPEVRIIIVLILLISVLLVGCSGKSSGGTANGLFAVESEARYDTAYESTGFSDSPFVPLEMERNRETGNQQTIQTDSTAMPVARKLIKQADLRIEADPSFIDSEGKLSGLNQKVDELMNRYGAYSESTRSDENTAHFTIRVPEVFYESLIAGTSVLGKTRSRAETAEDVTIKYYDLEGRLNTKKTLLATFQSYLSRTVSIDDIMKVETRIAELQNEIDWLGNQLTRLGNLVDYATVELTVYTYYSTPAYTFGDRVKQLFSGFGGFASNVLLGILWIIIYLVPIILVCLVAFWLLFGKVGILKKAFRSAMHGGNTKKNDVKNTDSNSGGNEE